MALTLADFLIQFIRITYIALGLITLADWLWWRDRTRLDIALFFASLAVIVGAQEVMVFTGLRWVWLVRFTQILLMANPYLLLRLVEHFRPVSRAVHWGAIIGLILSCLLLIVLPDLPQPLSLLLVVYFVAVDLYSVVALLQGAWNTRGVTRWRLQLAAWGTALIALVLFLAGLNVIVPSLAASLSLLIQALAVVSGLCYFAGFAPPRWLRHAWQVNELYYFMREAAGKPVEERGRETLTHLSNAAVKALGGRAAVAALWNPDLQQLVIETSTNPTLTGNLSTETGASGRAWQTRRPTFVNTPSDFSSESKALARQVGARSLAAAPIATGDRLWGLVVVLLPQMPLFPQDDMELIALFAEQSALTLEQMNLLNEQQHLLREQQKLVDQLRERTEQLEESNQELESFSYSVSHDLRAPLRHIEGFAEFLVRARVAEGDDKNRRHLNQITEAARRMGRLIDNLLTFSRLGRAALVMTPLELNGLVEDVRRELQPEMEGRSITWQVAALPRVYADAALLRQVLLNLLSNALKYTRPRTEVRIEIGCQDDKLGQTVIYVRDNGVGFDMAYTDKLFGVFQRLHHEKEFEGTGIGLANVQRIIHRHGGRVWAESTLGEGATFYFSLPARPDEVAHALTAAGLANPPAFPFVLARKNSDRLTPNSEESKTTQ